MDPLTKEPFGDSEDEPFGGFECSPFESSVEIADEPNSIKEDNCFRDNGEASAFSTANLAENPRPSGVRLHDGHKKSVQMQFEGKKLKPAARSSMKKEKPPDVTEELSRCKTEKSTYLEFSEYGLQSIPTGIFKELPHVETLFLNGNKLTGLSSGQLTSLPNLRLLMLQQNLIMCAGLPADLAKLNSLEVLDLRHNRLEKLLPDCIYGLSGLKQLILSYNKITALSDNIKNLQRLTILIVNRNSIQQTIPATIGQLSRLTKLDLSYNHIHTLPPSLCECVHLTELYLHYNQLTNLPEAIGDLANLTRLMLKYNRLVEIPESLAKCTCLDEFNIENNQLSNLPTDLLARMSSVRNVTLSRNLFPIFPPGGKMQYAHVLTLNMDHNRVTEIPPQVLVHLGQVTKLNLRDNAITTLPADDLCHWSTLVELDLGSNYLSKLPDELEALQSLEMFRSSYNQLQLLPNTIGNLVHLRILDLESNQLESLPTTIGQLINLQDLNVSCNRLKTFPPSIGCLSNLEMFRAGENDLQELPPDIGKMTSLRYVYLNDNRSLNNIPAEISQCPRLTILSVENCPLLDLPQPIVSGGSAMIIYFLQQVLQLRRQHTAL